MSMWQGWGLGSLDCLDGHVHVRLSSDSQDVRGFACILAYIGDLMRVVFLADMI